MANPSSLEYQLIATARVLQPQTGQAAATPTSGAQLVSVNYNHVTDDLNTAEDFQTDPLRTLAGAASLAIPFGTLPNARHIFIEAFAVTNPSPSYPAGFVPAVTIAINGGPASIPVSFFALDTTITPATSITVANPDPTLPVNFRYVLVGAP